MKIDTSFRPEPRRASLAARLYFYWDGLPPGTAVSMEDMKMALDVEDPQRIRKALTDLRKGTVPDPSKRGSRLRRLPVRYNDEDERYYNLGRVTPDGVARMIPGGVLSGAFAELITRVSTLENSMGHDGLVASAQVLLQDPDTRRLIEQIPLAHIWQVEDHLQHIARARQLLEIAAASGNQQLPEPDAGPDTEDET